MLREGGYAVHHHVSTLLEILEADGLERPRGGGIRVSTLLEILERCNRRVGRLVQHDTVSTLLEVLVSAKYLIIALRVSEAEFQPFLRFWKRTDI